MSLATQVQNAVGQAFAAVSDFQVSVLLSHSALGAIDSYTGKRAVTTSTQTISGLLGPVDTAYEDGKTVQRAILYFNDVPLTIALSPQDTAIFNGQVWTIEGPLEATLPEFVRSLRVRLP